MLLRVIDTEPVSAQTLAAATLFFFAVLPTCMTRI